MSKNDYINSKEKSYIYDKDMDYDVFCRVNSLSKEYEPNYKAFLKLESIWIDKLLNDKENV